MIVVTQLEYSKMNLQLAGWSNMFVHCLIHFLRLSTHTLVYPP